MIDVNQLQAMLENTIRSHLRQWEIAVPENLYMPVCYALQGGGKRIRPLLVLLGYHIFGEHPEEALPAAVAIEVFHNFTLLHDDIMDKAEIRRNLPTVYIRFSENNAILSGDVMAFLAYRLLLETKSLQLTDIITLFTRTAVEICEGQQLDLDFEKRLDITTEDYIRMIRLKTAVLLACALKTGAMLGGADENQATLLYEVGIKLGLAFQLNDDLLDAYGEELTFGKKIGGDIVSNKKTYLLTEALQHTAGAQRLELIRWLEEENTDRNEKIKAVRAIFDHLKIREITWKMINEYHTGIMDLLCSLTVEPMRKQPLIDQCNKLVRRQN